MRSGRTAALRCATMSSRIVVAADDPGAHDVRELLQQHLAFCRSCTPDEFVFALDVDALTGPDVAFVSARTDGGELLGVGVFLH